MISLISNRENVIEYQKNTEANTDGSFKLKAGLKSLEIFVN